MHKTKLKNAITSTAVIIGIINIISIFTLSDVRDHLIWLGLFVTWSALLVLLAVPKYSAALGKTAVAIMLFSHILLFPFQSHVNQILLDGNLLVSIMMDGIQLMIAVFVWHNVWRESKTQGGVHEYSKG